MTVIGHRKGRTIEQNMDANFGMAHPEGYRKALRLAHQAEKFHRPVINFVDTGGAFCGVGAEERGQGEAIARCLYEFIELKTPVISIVTGEGGSGGALALAVADRVLMLENALYSVISPRGCASILWKDPQARGGGSGHAAYHRAGPVQLGMIEGIIQEAHPPHSLSAMWRARCATSLPSWMLSRTSTRCCRNGMKNSAESEFSEQ